MERYALIADHSLSFLIIYLAALKPTLGNYTDRESALRT